MKIFQRRKSKTPSKNKTSSSVQTNSTTSSSSSSPACQNNMMTMYAQMSSTIAQALPSEEYESHHILYHPSRKIVSQVISPNPNRRDMYVPSTIEKKKKHTRGRDAKRRGKGSEKALTPKKVNVKLFQEDEKQVLEVPSPIHVVHKKQIQRDLPDISDDEGSIFFSYSADVDDFDQGSFDQDEIDKENQEIKLALEQLEAKARELQLEADRVIRQRKGEAALQTPNVDSQPVKSTPGKQVSQQMQNPNRKRLSIDTSNSMPNVNSSASKPSPNKHSSPKKPLAPGLANRLKIDTGFEDSNNTTPKTGVIKKCVKVFGHDQIHNSPECCHTGEVSPSSTVSSLTMPNELEYAHHHGHHNSHHRCTCQHSTLPMIHEDTGMLGEI
ncbi:predicted protein [Chaetoceros tenuissimus]|uniref:Uncharacterized protein n=1 Tax=Chaetoceros tenuissimus TaxID=426638 RepID=A0AAD3CDP6_9STRA|nr:predicted protein [Chaetoceros tenuissimus]